MTESFESILKARLSRRQALYGAAVSGLAVTMPSCSKKAQPIEAVSPQSLSFTELPHALDEHFAVAEGYSAQVLIAWGDPIFADAPKFDPLNQSEESQLNQFGYNNDYIGFIPFAADSSESEHGLLAVNHEATSISLMFPDSPAADELSLQRTLVDIAAHGLSVVEVKKTDNAWTVVKDSKFNRRITPNTEMRMTGAAAGDSRLITEDSKDGVFTLGTYGNCAGGVTPWGTVLTAEENVDGFFGGDISNSKEAKSFKRFIAYLNGKSWWKHFSRWNLQKNPGEILHMGWIVEIDPFDPDSVPMKRTSLGRFKHEGCSVYINHDKHVVGYCGDDARFEYIYKFVSKKKYQEGNRAANMRLLEEGDLFVARFLDDGSLQWLPLIYGEGPLTSENGFTSQADLMIDARLAADLLGATPMDRPEDVEVNPANGRVYAMLTNNSARSGEQIDSANPRANNGDGQIIEFWPEDGNHRADTFKWDLFLLAGDPARTETQYHSGISENGWLSCPDNCAFDKLGNLWIATDVAKGLVVYFVVLGKFVYGI